MADFGKLNFQVSFNPTTAFPLDARSYFTSLALAKAAAATAEEVGSKNTVYYFGMPILVSENNKESWYIIKRNADGVGYLVSTEESSGSGGTSFKTDSTLVLENGTLRVNTTNKVEADNTLPITSAGVHAQVGNIEVLLDTI